LPSKLMPWIKKPVLKKKKRGKKELWILAGWGLTTVILILPTWEVEIRRIMVWGQPGQKVCETPSQPTAGHRGSHLSAQLCRNRNRRIAIQSGQGIQWDPILKNNQEMTRALCAHVNNKKIKIKNKIK
jgi:hypothetical protein